MSRDECLHGIDRKLLLFSAVMTVSLAAATVVVFSDGQSDAESEKVQIPDWLADGAAYAEKNYYNADDRTQGYDFVVHYSNGRIVSIPCTEEHDEYEVRDLPKNSITVTCGSS